MVIALILNFTIDPMTFTDYQYSYKISIPNENWSFIEDFNKISVLKSDLPQFYPERVIDGLLIENSDKRLYIQVYTDDKPEEDLTDVIESERYYAEFILENGTFNFPESPVGNSVIVEWKEENSQIITREFLMKKNQLIYVIYYEIPFSEENTDITQEMNSIFLSLTVN